MTKAVDPQDTKSEEALLGAILLSPGTVKKARLDAELSPDDFYRERYGHIWDAATRCLNNGGCDTVAVAAELKRRGQLNDIGGVERLQQLVATVPAPGNAKAYAERVKETSELRKLRRFAQSVIDGVDHEDKTTIARALDSLGQRVLYVDVNSGEVIDTCPSCENNTKIIDEKERRIRGLELARANQRKDREAEARKDPLYPEALGIFDWWRIACNHPDVSFTYEEFELIAPHLRRAPKKEAHYNCLEAIAGAAFNPFEAELKNGNIDRKDDWELIFRNRGKLRSFQQRAPKDWRRWLLAWIEAQFRDSAP